MSQTNGKTTITDLDAIAGPDKQVQVGGVVYKLPADCPIDLYLKLKHYGAQEELDDETVVEDLYGELLSLFQIRQPKLERLPIGVTALMQAIPRIYGEVDEEERPTAPAAGTKSTSRRKSAAGSRS